MFLIQAINKMTKLVFNHTHLHDLKTAIGEVLDVFMELVETPSKSLKDFKNRLEKVVCMAQVAFYSLHTG